MEIIAHRGACSLAPENTLSAITKALALGVTSIEIDCQLTGDQKVVACHDKTLKRIAHREDVTINQSPYNYLRTIDIGNGERIPLLEEIITRIPVDCTLIIDSKVKGTAQKIAPILKSRFTHNSIEITSSYIDELLEAKKNIPAVRVSYVCENQGEDLDFLRAEYGITTFSIDRSLAEENLMRAWVAKKFTMRVFTVNNEAEALTIESWGVQGIFTDYPQLFVNVKAKAVLS